MSRTGLRLFLVVPLAAAAGCAAALPPDYSPGYSYVSTAGGGQTLAPDACLAQSADIPPPRQTSDIGPLTPELGPHIPPGCANAYNLQRIAERQRDLVEGRRMGPGSGAVTARAARRFIYGDEQPTGGANPGPPPEASVETAP